LPSLWSLQLAAGRDDRVEQPAATTPTFAITNVSPTMAGPGSLVTLTGYGFGSVQSTNTVTYNGVTVTPTGWNNNSITVTLPSTATTGGVFNVVIGGVLSGSSNPITIKQSADHQRFPVSGDSGFAGHGHRTIFWNAILRRLCHIQWIPGVWLQLERHVDQLHGSFDIEHQRFDGVGHRLQRPVVECL